MKNKHITENERYLIEFLYKKKYSVTQIAAELGKCKKTIYNELNRGMVQLLNSDLTHRKEYSAQKAQQDYDYKQTIKGTDLKIANDYEFIQFIENKILKEKYSPYAALQMAKKQGFKTDICLTTLYSYIHMGLFANIYQIDMPYQKRQKKDIPVTRINVRNVDKPSITDRPEDIKKRDTFGHWEMDTVYSGKNKSKACLLVLTERSTRREIIMKMKDRSASSTVKCLNKLYRSYGSMAFRKIFKTITVDNGNEFSDYKNMTKYNKTKIYYCHPYSSWERGSNENANKLIRRFIKKGEDISQYTDRQIKDIENWINNLPRKIFNGLSSNDMLKMHKTEYASLL